MKSTTMTACVLAALLVSAAARVSGADADLEARKRAMLARVQDVIPKELAEDKTWFRQIREKHPAMIRDGILDVTLYDGWAGNPVDPTGRQDSLKALQKAIIDARDEALAAFFPSGTYLVSDTLNCMKKITAIRKGKKKGELRWMTWDGKRVIVLIGSNKGERPVIKLVDGAAGFDEPEDPKPVVIVWTQPEGEITRIKPAQAGREHGNGFNMIYRGIDIDIGKGNRGAIGLCMTGAQGCSIEDCRVNATGGYAGFFFTPGAGAGVANIEVEGGDYGLYCPNNPPSSVIVGGIFKNQRVRSFHCVAFTHIGFVGCTFVKKEAPIVSLAKYDWCTVGGGFFMKDCRIELEQKNGRAAIDNDIGQIVYLKDVYLRGADHVLEHKGTKTIPCPADAWTHVAEYACRKDRTDIIVNGKITNEEYVRARPSPAGPPADLIARHIWQKLPSFEDADAKNVRDPNIGAVGDGKADDTAALQKAIDTHRKVFLPKGRYKISRTLNLKADTILFGSAKTHVEITNDVDWHPPVPTPMVRTVDDPQARTWLGHVKFQLKEDTPANDKVYILHWRAGRSSVVKSLQDGKTWAKKNKPAGSLYRVSGNGGGKWYFWTCFSGHYRDGGCSEDFRFMTIENTREPLIFYGFNPEHNGAAMVDVRNARNVDILATKVEHVRSPSIAVFNSQNVNIIGFGGHAGSGPDRGLIEVSNARDVSVALVGSSRLRQDGADRRTGKPPKWYALLENHQNHRTQTRQAVAFFRRD